MSLIMTCMTINIIIHFFFFFSSRRRHTRFDCDWSSDVCSSDLEALAEASAALSREPLVAADTEAASFHRYHDRIFLIQLSSPSRTEIIDPLAVADLSPVGRLLADPKVEKIFHDADYDLRILDRDYGFRARRLFDTRIAAQLAGQPAGGLPAPFGKDARGEVAKGHPKGGPAPPPPPPPVAPSPPAGTAPPPGTPRAR